MRPLWEAAETTVRRFRENCDMEVSYSFDNVTSDSVTPETKPMMVEDAHKRELRLDELKLSEQADLTRRYSQLSEEAQGDDKRSIPDGPARHAKQRGAHVSIKV